VPYDFCLKSLPMRTSACDSQLGPIIDKICGEDKNIQQALDACHNGKVTAYYKVMSTMTNSSLPANNKQ
jgi:hypothetical protein